MRLKIEKVLADPVARDIRREGQEPLKLTTARVAGTVDGERHGEMLVKAWNGDETLIVAGAELYAKADEKRREGDPPSFVVGPIKAAGSGRGGARGGGGGGLSAGQFCLQQRGMLAVAALAQAVEMVKGTDKKAIPLADEMFKWLREKSLIEVEENAAKGGAA
jgi:hypothetical protein